MIERINRGVLDTPLSRGMTAKPAAQACLNVCYSAASFFIAALIDEAASS